MHCRCSVSSRATFALLPREVLANHGEETPLESLSALGLGEIGSFTAVEVDTIDVPADAAADIGLIVAGRGYVGRDIDVVRHGRGSGG
jgi:hypothetical protein